MAAVGWSELDKDLVDSVADRVSSSIDFTRIRSICGHWRSSVATEKRSRVVIKKPSPATSKKRSAVATSSSAVTTKKRFPDRFPTYLPYDTDFKKTIRLLYPTSFYRVSLPSSSACPSKGWLIKTRQFSKTRKNLVFPLSRQLMTPYKETLDLLNVGVTEILQASEIYVVSSSKVLVNYRFSKIHQCYEAEYVGERKRMLLERRDDFEISHEISRVALVEDMIFAVNLRSEIWCCKTGKGSDCRWTRIECERSSNFLDIVVHKGQVHALDKEGAIFWIKASELKIYQYCTPSTLKDYYNELYYREAKRLVEFCGQLCIIHRFYKKDKDYDVKNIHFKVSKMDEDLIRWVEVNTLGDKALIVADDKCFTVSASEYYGCLENAIYFTDYREGASVFKLDDKSIITQKNGCYCFDMFTPPFL